MAHFAAAALALTFISIDTHRAELRTMQTSGHLIGINLVPFAVQQVAHKNTNEHTDGHNNLCALSFFFPLSLSLLPSLSLPLECDGSFILFLFLCFYFFSLCRCLYDVFTFSLSNSSKRSDGEVDSGWDCGRDRSRGRRGPVTACSAQTEKKQCLKAENKIFIHPF